MLAEAQQKREELIDQASAHFSDELTDAILEEKGKSQRRMINCRSSQGDTGTSYLTPVIIGSAYKNKGVQLLLNAVAELLPISGRE